MAVLALVGCGDDGGTPAADATPNPIDGAAGPSVAIALNPTTVAPGGDIETTVTVTGFTLVDFAAAPPNAPGEGHYHIYLDNATGPDYEVAAFDGTDTITLDPAIAAGMHTLRVQLMNNDHTPVTPTVEASASFTVQ